MSTRDTIQAHVSQYQELALFRAFREDRIDVPRFAVFFPEMAMVARIFQDLIWALTEIHDGPYAAFAQNHRKRDSGHYRWMAFDLEKNGFPEATLKTHYSLEGLHSRTQMARILALTHQASPEERMVILAALEAAGEVTLSTLNSFVERHGLGDHTRYLGSPHMRIEATQVDEIEDVASKLLSRREPTHDDLVVEVFDALTELFRAGGRRFYPDILGEEAA